MSMVSTSCCPGSGRPQSPPRPSPAFTTLLTPSTPLVLTSPSQRTYFRKYGNSHCIALGRFRTSRTILRPLFLLDSYPGQGQSKHVYAQALPPSGRRSLHLPPRPTSPWSLCCMNGLFSLWCTNLSLCTIFFLIYDILNMLHLLSSM